MHEVWGTVAGRWYVTLFGAVFLWRAVRHIGWRKTALYLAVALVVGGLAENGSVHFGVPYTRYAFDPSLRGKELFLGDVPLFVPLSYTFMGYFAFASGRLLASGPARTRGSKAWHEWLMAEILAVWALWILDPMTRLGAHFYLGRVFRYAGPGFWFGLPTGSQLGFALTAAMLLAVLFGLTRDEANVPVRDGFTRHPHLVALLTYHGEVLHLAIVGWWIGTATSNTIAGAAVLMWVPIAAMTAVHWSHLRATDRISTTAPGFTAPVSAISSASARVHSVRTLSKA
jgi:hypothetical protein